MALEMGATGLILCHNHPSGTLVPSDADKQITKKLRTGDSLEIKVLDHLIVTSLVILVLLTKEYFKKNIMKITNIKMSFDLDHTLWDFDKNSEITFEGIFQEITRH
jgi:hypothetical protein